MIDNYVLLIRNGYGSNFNKIYINYENNLLKKESYNSYGKKKISYEIELYKYISDNKINFPIPNIYFIYDNGYIMEYLNNFRPLYTIFKTLNKTQILLKINQILLSLHSFEKKHVTKEIYYFHLNIEIQTKITDRIQLINPIIEKYNYIKTINNKPIIPFQILISQIRNCIYNILDNKNEYFFVPIHGDCQFNNILYNSETEQIIFIDPRGYYGENNIFGIPEYDHAKIKFALTGYDEFDNRNIEHLDIQNDNINIFIDFLDETILKDKSLSTLLMITIWLSNAHCFLSNENKCIYSYFIALYLGTLYFTK
jgi:hypothetical protein